MFDGLGASPDGETVFVIVLVGVFVGDKLRDTDTVLVGVLVGVSVGEGVLVDVLVGVGV